MKRKLISFDAFKSIEEQSLTNAQAELIGVEDMLAKALGVDDLKLFTFGEDDVTYQAPDGTYIHATYKVEKDNLILENIEQLVIDEETENKKNREVLSNLVDALLENNELKANSQFDEYMATPSVRRGFLVNENINETAFAVTVSKPTGKRSPLLHHRQSRSLVAKRTRARNKTLARLSDSQKKQLARRRKMVANKLGKSSNPRWRVYARKIKPAHMKEWATMCENVMGYLDYKEFGPVINESFVRQDNNGNITGLSIPTQHKRNESKILSFNWKTLDHEVKVLRGNIKKLSEDQVFIKAMADLKRYNNISDNNNLQETLEAIASNWPNVLYITETELAAQISSALETANVKNYDDQICAFMAEAILRTAHSTFVDRVRKIGSLAGATNDITSECKTCEDAYLEFKKVVEPFYAQLDESDNYDLRVFADLFKALHEVHRIAIESGDEVTKAEVENFMNECSSILNRETEIDLSLAETIANYLDELVETNLQDAEENWNVSNDTHSTVNGDHPRMSWIAKQTDATPSKLTGDWGDEAPVSDGKSYKNGLADEMRNRSWGNHGGDGVYPDLNNPYILKPFGDYKMKGEKSVVDDGDNDWNRLQSSDTWPNLKNPYVPEEKNTK